MYTIYVHQIPLVSGIFRLSAMQPTLVTCTVKYTRAYRSEDQDGTQQQRQIGGNDLLLHLEFIHRVLYNQKAPASFSRRPFSHPPATFRTIIILQSRLLRSPSTIPSDQSINPEGFCALAGLCRCPFARSLSRGVCAWSASNDTKPSGRVLGIPGNGVLGINRDGSRVRLSTVLHRRIMKTGREKMFRSPDSMIRM
jgi:hypothetical protein